MQEAGNVFDDSIYEVLKKFLRNFKNAISNISTVTANDLLNYEANLLSLDINKIYVITDIDKVVLRETSPNRFWFQTNIADKISVILIKLFQM